MKINVLVKGWIKFNADITEEGIKVILLDLKLATSSNWKSTKNPYIYEVFEFHIVYDSKVDIIERVIKIYKDDIEGFSFTIMKTIIQHYILFTEKKDLITTDKSLKFKKEKI